MDIEAVKAQLEQVKERDQRHRQAISQLHDQPTSDAATIDSLWVLQTALDEENLEAVIRILDELDQYPGRSLVGSEASEAVFYVLQHAPDSIQIKYLDLILTAAAASELNKRLAAMYHDRALMNQGKPQIYGTQYKSVFRLDTVTGQRMDSIYHWPMRDTTKIDSIRLWNGLGPLEESLQSIGLSRWK